MMHALGVAFMKMGILCTGWWCSLKKKGGARNGGGGGREKKISYQQATSYTAKDEASHTQPHNVSAFLQGFMS